MASRPQRTIARRPPPGARITPRDILLTNIAAECGSILRRHIEVVADCSREASYRLGRRVRDLGLLRVISHGASLPSVYVLGPQGKELLARIRGEEEAAAFPLRRTVKRQGLDHHHMAVDVVVAVLVASARSPSLELVSWQMEWRIRRELRQHGTAVRVPDAVLVVREHTGRRHAVAVEADRGTERPSVFVNKLIGYAKLKELGTPLMDEPSWSVAVCVPSGRRANRLLRAIVEDGRVPEGLVSFLPHDELATETILKAETWSTFALNQEGTEAHVVPGSPFNSPPQTSPSKGLRGLDAATSRDCEQGRQRHSPPSGHPC